MKDYLHCQNTVPKYIFRNSDMRVMKRYLFRIIMEQAQQQAQGSEVMIPRHTSKARDVELKRINKDVPTVAMPIPPSF